MIYFDYAKYADDTWSAISNALGSGSTIGTALAGAAAGGGLGALSGGDESHLTKEERRRRALLRAVGGAGIGAGAGALAGTGANLLAGPTDSPLSSVYDYAKIPLYGALTGAALGGGGRALKDLWPDKATGLNTAERIANFNNNELFAREQKLVEASRAAALKAETEHAIYSSKIDKALIGAKPEDTLQNLKTLEASINSNFKEDLKKLGLKPGFIGATADETIANMKAVLKFVPPGPKLLAASNQIKKVEALNKIRLDDLAKKVEAPRTAFTDLGKHIAEISAVELPTQGALITGSLADNPFLSAGSPGAAIIRENAIKDALTKTEHRLESLRSPNATGQLSSRPIAELTRGTGTSIHPDFANLSQYREKSIRDLIPFLRKGVNNTFTPSRLASIAGQSSGVSIPRLARALRSGGRWGAGLGAAALVAGILGKKVVSP
jgi:hypothetical protein